jgi:GAF domain-containing protein
MAGPDTAQHEDDEENLYAALRGLRGLTGGTGSMTTLLADIAHLAARAIPCVDGVSVASFHMVDGLLQVQAWQISAPFIRDVDILQYVTLNQGPCIACMQTRLPIVSASLAIDTRWPRFGSRVAELGVESALSLPLLTGDQLIGSINCYARDRDAFGHHAVELGMTFAHAAAVSLDHSRRQRVAHERNEQRKQSLRRGSAIDQAIGIIRGRTGASGPDALAHLRQTGPHLQG